MHSLLVNAIRGRIINMFMSDDEIRAYFHALDDVKSEKNHFEREKVR